MSIRRRYHLRKASIKQLSSDLVKRFGKEAPEVLMGAVELLKLEDGREVILADGKPFLLKTLDGLFPTLTSIDQIPLKHVTINMGAVPHVVARADIMAPGVVAADEDIAPGDGVVIVDERHCKPIAIGLALVGSASMKAPKGRVVKNIHCVGDEVWQLSSTRKG
ncbi:MAG: hypothetical protein AVW06_03085 [Hadesarchaea archaeon DG-33-1]|nr:MAG: hypothetical protein AVW06_03085 [Hadesarchaea archaeon DG-33-1]